MEERNLVKAHLLIHIHLSALLPGGAAGRPSANCFSDQGSILFLAKHFFLQCWIQRKELMCHMPHIFLLHPRLVLRHLLPF